MNKTQVFSVALKYLAILFLITGVFELIQLLILFLTVGSYTDTPTLQMIFEANTSYSKIISPFYYLIVGYFLWKKSDKLANRFVPSIKEQTSLPENLLLIVVAYQGISSIVDALFKLTVTTIKNSYLVGYIPMGVFPQELNLFLSSFFLYLVELILGIFILLYAPRISAFIWNKVLIRFWPNSLDKWKKYGQ